MLNLLLSTYRYCQITTTTDNNSRYRASVAVQKMGILKGPQMKHSETEYFLFRMV